MELREEALYADWKDNRSCSLQSTPKVRRAKNRPVSSTRLTFTVDTNTFASACLDRTVKIWSLGSSTANFTLEAHEQKGVNYVDYYPHSDKPYLLT